MVRSTGKGLEALDGMALKDREIARAFVEARRSGRAIDAYPGVPPTTLAQAYAIQDAALELWDRPVGGWKVGKINSPLDKSLGANRLVGPAFEDSILDLRDGPAITPVFAGGFAAAEAEFMLRLAPRSGASVPKNNEEAMEWVDTIRLGIEIASSPYRFINRDGPCVTISDHGNNFGLVLGQEVPRAQWSSLDTIEVKLETNGEVLGVATTATMLDGPFGALRFLLQNLVSRGIPLRNGWWVSSGAITGVHDVIPGDRVTATFADLGTVHAEIATLDLD